jgi:hypothetical protein
MRIHQWEVWKSRPPGFNSDHWFVIVSGQERCDEPRQLYVNGLACFTLRGALGKTEAQLDSADGFAGPTAVQCDYIYSLEKAALHSSQGLVSWERKERLKSKLKEVLRL